MLYQGLHMQVLNIIMVIVMMMVAQYLFYIQLSSIHPHHDTDLASFSFNLGRFVKSSVHMALTLQHKLKKKQGGNSKKQIL